MRPPDPIAASPAIWNSPILRLLARPFRKGRPVAPAPEVTPEKVAVQEVATPPTPPVEEPAPEASPTSPKRKSQATRKRRKPLPEPVPATWILVAPNRYIRAEEPTVEVPPVEVPPELTGPEGPAAEAEPVIEAETSGLP